MSRIRSPFVYLFLLIAISLNFYHLKCEARDIIHATDPLINRGETLVSAGNIFELGFFSSEGNEKSSRYVGIWYYNLVPRTIVWVARRDYPLVDSCGSFGFKEDGNIKIWCSNGDVFPVTSLESSGNLNRTLQLLDSGNLVLVDGQSGSTLWQSFNDSTDTFLPGMKLNDVVTLTSWKSPTDPGTGNYTFRQDQGVYVIQKRSAVHWKSLKAGPFGDSDEIPNFVHQMLSGDSNPSQSLGNRTNDRYISYGNYTRVSYYDNSRLVLNSSGEIGYYNLRDSGNWSLLWSAPMDPCSIYNACGKFGICKFNKPICICPLGFKPASSEDWEAGQYSEGCDRESTKCSHEDTFLNVSHIKVYVGGEVTPFDLAKEEEECKQECLNDCNCQAYSYRDANISERETGKSAPKCWVWTNDLVNLHQDNTDGSLNISLRLYSSTAALVNATVNGLKPPKRNSGKTYVIVITVVIAGVILGSCLSCILYKKRRMARQSGNRGITGDTPVPFPNQSERQANHLMQENDKLIDVPFYNLDIILSATDNFSNENKLGQGGFGPVYKGNFAGGHEIAVKRLSSCSVQGIEEFLNEVVLIAKLQHRNLVRLLGYCIKDNEKILLYEYMPNRSLDAFLFDQRNSLLLDWTKRFDIILGIARGLLYLHQDSRLRIIHRDLKTSNILLDEDMNPKISDFGLARIVEGKGTEASTNKVVGTYGYMSPEYALDGKFSVKSDVFSFGVVMLEIISGKKNNGFYNPHEFLNLLGYAWRLWSENKALDLIDPTLLESCERSQAMKCINIGLLCVQEDPNERPSMSTIVITLGSESAATLPLPTQPAFVVRRRVSSTSSSSTKPDTASVNELTVSMAEGR